MKKVWKYGRTGGQELQVSDDFPMQVPFTDVAPLPTVNLEDQFFIPSENRWKEISNQLDKENLDNLSILYKNLEKDNELLKAKANDLAEIGAKSMLSIVQITGEIGKINEQLKGGAK
ncbi:hypothetical protein [Enterococcus faecalis]|uniref:hypothetical protein n=1 Tax=Enterococcus faecalis TaxID=1351 RepID=UPI0025A2B7DB|nr:hypothetical protein [Enterococcus faecalis]